MITRRTGNGQTECRRCKEKGKFALSWDSFLYTFNNKPYCFDCLMEMLEEKDKIISKLEKLIEQYSKNDYYYKYNGKYLKSEIIKDLKELKGDANEL